MKRPSLTWREREVECLAQRGMTDKAIGAYLDISTFTASRHIERILEKRGVANRHDLKRVEPRLQGFVGYIGPQHGQRNKTWEIYRYEDDHDGYPQAELIDPDYDATSGKPEPLLYVRDFSEIFVLDGETE